MKLVLFRVLYKIRLFSFSSKLDFLFIVVDIPVGLIELELLFGSFETG
jgi:hypothetical protein